ncbi:MAG: flavodoxin [candidate division WS6 bacterium GW2011_GWC1_33_20]|uniref:Flavodoxin n=2 Tax=Candidatus Dojkabacteria TaxID=74243 RepID=A0A0G0AED6_9BACT|nr:MAG: flavodoxin [candidate division WS6 bacterium GW2011_GWE2_33_157]KKP43853.1 MAG: flavodoxin [candidate division WS6 bacterium GW2011_GWC1_33_20]KKP44356.1 MAG: flavodoxin [candidate division WS6 bacterium GW2011_GWF1_33_233]KKP54841.1 MAG: flavodoxin [candidate division WS6 bacterium GW2011_WS6_33_547]KKP54973.1 MAG: Flavodoxin [candidate division WS6 bacterium GW2011_GWB1_33_6]KKP56574.1 MAG: Flavodoxin [candidate division WS6 bacterium GW2011_GWF2_33_92]KKP81630.1 MAG: Flavodoxin [ca
MNTLVLFDSQFGNTQKIAKAISESFPSTHKVKLLNINEMTNKELKDTNLLVVGSPTHGGRATEELQAFFNQLPQNSLKDIKLASFDTRFKEQDLNFALKVIIKIFGFAAPRINKTLESKGAKSIIEPEGFIVKESEGPLADGEIERTKEWVKQILISLEK